MKKPTKLIMLLMLIFILPVAFAAGEDTAKKAEASGAAAKYKPTSPQLNRAQFDALLAKPDQLLIIDLRRPDEVSSKGGFPAYLSIQAGDLEKSLAFIPKDRTIVTVSNHAGRSGKSADLLASKGYKVAGFVGAEYYEQEGGKLTKIAVPAAKPTTEQKS